MPLCRHSLALPALRHAAGEPYLHGDQAGEETHDPHREQEGLGVCREERQDAETAHTIKSETGAGLRALCFRGSKDCEEPTLCCPLVNSWGTLIMRGFHLPLRARQRSLSTGRRQAFRSAIYMKYKRYSSNLLTAPCKVEGWRRTRSRVPQLRKRSCSQNINGLRWNFFLAFFATV